MTKSMPNLIATEHTITELIFGYLIYSTDILLLLMKYMQVSECGVG